MAEAIFLSAIQQMERSIAELVADEFKFFVEQMEESIKDLRMIMDLMRDNKLEERSRLSYLIGDLVELAQDFLNTEDGNFYMEVPGIRIWLEKIKRCVLEPGDEEERRETGGEGEGDEDVVGLEEHVEAVLNEGIFNEPLELQHVQIGGMVGIGKTTLARQLYNHEEVVDQFKRRAWVCVSGELSYKELLIKLLQQVVVESEDMENASFLEEMERADNQSLQQMLCRKLQGMQYFIVIDDLPRDMSLRPILRGLAREDKGSRLLITSRSGFIQPRIHYSHDIKTLDSDNCWQLFLKTILRGNEFISEDEFPKQLKKKVIEMLISKCGGLPLAIKEVGRQLAERRKSGIEWEALLDSIDFSSTLDLLEVFYNGLDLQMKSHFLYLAFFKENTSTRVDKLEQIWVVGGMVLHPKVGYTMYLALESIIEVEAKSTDYGHKSCRVNPILHKLSIKKAKEEIGFEIISSSGNNRPSQNPCNRVIVCSREKYNYFKNEDKHLLSLFFHGGGYFDASPSYWKSLQLLRILDWEDFGLKILPEGIGALMELRYLGLRNNYIQELPNSLESLKKLEVLDLDQNFMVEVPDILWKMGTLRQLYMSDIICRKPLKIEALQDLEILTYISVDNWTYELPSLQMMTSLSKLGIEEVDEELDVSKLFASLAELKGLGHLILRGFRFKSMPCMDELGVLHNVTKLKLDGLLPMLPNVQNFPPNIEYLVLVNSCLDEDPMPVLEKLPKLTHLKLRNAYTGRQMVILHHGFPKLDVLGIEELWNLRELQVGEDAIPDLMYLEIKNCPHLEALPEEIGWMTRLHQLTMVTTKRIARKISKPALISELGKVEIYP